MEKLIEKMEVYQFINYIFPGVIFGKILTEIMGQNYFDSNIIVAVIEYYFVGLVLSRLGSVLIKPILEKLKLVNFEAYEEYIKSDKKDKKIDLLQRDANQYRTYIAIFICLFIVELFLCFRHKKIHNIIFLFIALIIIFILSYRKQINFVTKRINIICKK